MRAPVHNYSLGQGASRLDRVTLSVWRAWDGWIRPTVAAVALIVIGHLFVALASGITPNRVTFNAWRYLVKWGANPQYPVPHGSATFLLLGGTGVSRGILTWSIGAQVVASLVGAFAAWWVLKRNPRPVGLGLIAGTAAAVVHVAMSRTFTLYPLGGAAAGYNVAALIALWSPILFGAGVGRLAAGKRRRALAEQAG